MSTTDMVSAGGRQAAPMGMTAYLLLGLLSEEERYRRVWRARMDRTPTSEVQQSAVARVLAEHLWESGQVDEADEALPRRLKDTVARALSGRNLSPRTLRMFVDAFDMAADDRALLWDCLEREVGAEARRVRAQDPARSTRAVRPGAWESTTLHALHTVGAHGLVQHRLVHVVRALEPVTTVRLPLAPVDATVVARHGASVGITYRAGGRPSVVDLHLLQPLGPGDTAVLEYDVLPARGALGTEARTVLHGMATGGTAVVQIRFHPRRRPAELWWWRRDGQGVEVDAPVRVDLAPDHGAHRVLTGGGVGAAGFRWAW